MDKLEVLTRKQFFDRYPPNERAVRVNETVIPVGEEILCDFCNTKIVGENKFFLLNQSYALCATCGQRVAKDIISSKSA